MADEQRRGWAWLKRFWPSGMAGTRVQAEVVVMLMDDGQAQLFYPDDRGQDYGAIVHALINAGVAIARRKGVPLAAAEIPEIFDDAERRVTVAGRKVLVRIGTELPWRLADGTLGLVTVYGLRHHPRGHVEYGVGNAGEGVVLSWVPAPAFAAAWPA